MAEWARRIACRRGESTVAVHGVLVLDAAFAEMADVEGEIVLDARVGHLEAAVGPDDPAGVAHLSAHLAVERRAVEHDHRRQLAVQLVELVGKLVVRPAGPSRGPRPFRSS